MRPSTPARLLLCGLLAGLLAACSASEAPTAASGSGLNVGDVALADWQPLPPPPPVTPETQALRETILGPDPTDPAQVKIWWYGVSSFIAAIGGHLFLFDAWEIVGAHENYVPIGREELAALMPEAILIGHGHFDHAADAGYIAGRSGAALVAGDTVCATARERAARDGNAANFPCLILGDVDTPGPGTVRSVRLWADLPPIQVLHHSHSAADPADLASGGVPLIFVPELVSFLTHLNTDPQEIAWTLESLTDDGGFGEPTGGTWAYHLRIGDFGLLWHDSVGRIDDGEPHAQAIRAALGNFPGCVDVQLGAIVGFGMVTSALRDARLYVEHAHPRISLPSHHDAWAPVLGGGAASYETQWREALGSLPQPPELDYLRDPDDYLVPRSYRVDDPRWSTPVPGSTCRG